MSFLHVNSRFAKYATFPLDPSGKLGNLTQKASDTVGEYFQGSKPGPPPPVPNPNDAANAAQSQTDSLRLRRGMLANIFAGASATQPVSGKTQLGT